MDWGWFLWARGWGCDPAGTGADREESRGSVDLGLLGLYYGTVAARLSCGRCGARLRRAVRVAPALRDPTIGAIAVTTRCRGWWRHRHRATVTGRAAGQLRLNDLRPV